MNSDSFLAIILLACFLFFIFYNLILGIIERKIERESSKIANYKFELLAARLKDNIKNTESELVEKYTSIKHELELEEKRLISEKLIQEKLFEEKTIGFPWVAQMYSNYIQNYYESIEDILAIKRNPSIKSAEVVAELKRKSKKFEEKYFTTLGLLKYYESLHPEIKNFIDESSNRETKTLKDSYLYKDLEKEVLLLRDKQYKNEKLLTEKSQTIKHLQAQLETHNKDYLAKDSDELITLLNELDKYKKELREVKEEEVVRQKIFEEKTIGFPWAAKKLSSYIALRSLYLEEYFLTKKRPALKASEEIKLIRQELQHTEEKYFIATGLLEYYQSLFPNLEEYQEIPDEILSCNSITKDIIKPVTTDPAKSFLSDEEWKNLSRKEKFQKSLERYCSKKKSNWEIGREYERYIGYEYEKIGWTVKYFGAVKGLEDLGRDLIVSKGGEIRVIQCKYWAKEKVIHEKHIFQLYGTSILYMLDNSLLIPPKPFFVTSCKLSETAKRIASFLDVQVIENKPMLDYPRIKCNIGKENEKIYHLPFDQQYDKIKIDPKNGEFYCMNIDEAESAGFRRAHRWLGK